MILKYVLVVFIYILNKVLTATVIPKQEKVCQKLNVVLFFAKTSFNLPKEASAMKLLEMHEAANVKTTFPGSRNSAEAFGNIMSRCSPSCKELLKESLTSLVHYCENALGMKTAIVSVSNSQITNDISSGEVEIPPELREPLPKSEPLLLNSQHFPRDTLQKEIDTNGQRSFRVTKFLQNPEMVNMKNVITSPEHTEVFKIRVKRQLPGIEKETKRGEIVDVPLERENKKNSWDILDIMSHVRFSFFGKLFEDESKKKLSEEENKIADDLTPKKEDPGLFETVQTLINTFQENPEQPFFITIFGGHLSEISDSKSALIQTIKHVIECTDRENTLIVLTGSCPEEHEQEHEFGRGHEFNHKSDFRHGPEFEHKNYFVNGHKYGTKRQYKRHNKRDENIVHINENSMGCRSQNDTIPVFAKGPDYAKLSQCSLLFDIPVVVKTILEQISPNFGGEQFGQPRPKRSIFGDIRMNRANYENVSDRNKYKSVILFVCVITLFII